MAVLASAACSGGYEIVARPADTSPRGSLLPVAWAGPSLASDMVALARWREAVGPPVAVSGRDLPAVRSTRLVVANWNVHVGAGDIPRLVADLRTEFGAGTPLVLLIQEAFRAGPEVPADARGTELFAAAIRGLPRDGTREEIEAVAGALGLHAYYVPSMRNGPPGLSDEDRGNAILSTLPLNDLEAIELPFERQRRVAVAATVEGVDRRGAPWQLRVVSAHLDTMAGARRLWLAGSEYARTRQAHGLVSALADDGPAVLGADLNTLFGFHDAAYAVTSRAFPDTRVSDRGATFLRLLRLDHLFFRLPDGWNARFSRAPHNYGSDHTPLIGTIDFVS